MNLSTRKIRLEIELTVPKSRGEINRSLLPSKVEEAVNRAIVSLAENQVPAGRVEWKCEYYYRRPGVTVPA